MHENYADITSRILESPRWWDSNGTPRYAAFSPDLCPNIYSNIVVLLRIRCQDCGELFDVEMHAGIFGEWTFNPRKLHYGDPPVHGCVGDTMNCEDIAVLQVWRCNPNHVWHRMLKLEGPIE